MRTSKAATAAVLAGATMVWLGVYFARELDNGLVITLSREGEEDEGGAAKPALVGGPSDKALTRLEHIREILLKEFMEEEERLNGIESDKKAEVARLEEIYETRIRALGREIAVLKKKNEQLSVFAGKAASYDALKLRAEREIAAMGPSGQRKGR